MNNRKLIIDILKSRGLYIYLIIALTGFILGIWFPWTAIIGAVLLSTVYDLIGYEKAVLHQEVIPSYRITAFIFWLTLQIALLSIYGFHVWGSFFNLWLFGVCDILYYIIGRYQFPKVWDWLTWTPLGWFKSDLSNKTVLIQATIVILIVIASYIWK